jgi:hypothetical protein
MNKRIKEIVFESVNFRLDPDSNAYEAQVCPEDLESLAELIIADCADVLFEESIRLFELYSEENNLRLSEEYHMCSNQCLKDIAVIEKHFGVDILELKNE